MRGIDLDGNEVVLEGDDLLARMIQHEIDHLDGVLLLDRSSPTSAARRCASMRTRELGRRRTPSLAVTTAACSACGPVRLVFFGTPADAVPPLRGAARRRPRDRARRHPARPAPRPRGRAATRAR